MCRAGLSLVVAALPLAAAGNGYGKLPLSFEPNQGQTDARVKFLSRAPGYTLFVTSEEAVFAGRDGSVERMKLLGANPAPRFEPLDKQPGISNYFIGNDPSKWRTSIPTMGAWHCEECIQAAAYLRKGLSEHGYVADIASNGEAGLYLARNSEYDLLILDVMLPRRDGWSVIAELRRVGKLGYIGRRDG